jgi:hypothetical protein
MEGTEEKIDKPVENRRPPSLTMLCVLTFIGSGSAFFSNLFFGIFYYQLPEAFEQLKKNGMIFPGMEMIKFLPRQYFIYTSLLSAISLLGAIQMWKLKKIGFHFYTASQLFLIILSMIFIGISVSSGTTFLTIAFILLYAMNLKFMKN